MLEMDKDYGFGAKFEEDSQMGRDQFTLAQMEKMPSDKWYYMLQGYDEDGYWQAGCLQGTAQQVINSDWEVYGGWISRSVETYRRLYGDEFVESILRA